MDVQECAQEEGWKCSKNPLLRNIPEAKEERIEKILESLNLQSIESWNEQQQQSARALIRNYQHLFALTLTSWVKPL